MEGRAIARPNSWRSRSRLPATGCFNGGPGNCPAERPATPTPPTWTPSFNGGPGNCPAEPAFPATSPAPASVASMEGRAIARPNQRVDGVEARPGIASMEGRAIARPNRQCMLNGIDGAWRFNGGPGNCPAEPRRRRRRSRSWTSLQWRAGQLPGRTWWACWRSSCNARCFNGGPGNCPAEPPSGEGRLHRDRRASMEGRAIARPNRPATVGHQG